ncbi:HlyD family efflux transporter periplasmic adaptor subunit [Loktanella sp. F6476L]|uniref:HlyD family efflux transporter periplasmic adaptor subunit n=2 Tax=Rhodobacterales TaxID=204455 RepID=UPI001FF431C6|nr:HlyD family efflux transporter periplasmic adaptor subunit [Loktanella sp. F6476L]MCK0120917.1 HlyD family efflux transporter periplasmic adaptor subunit [Loktanella sp. F6476L]
MATVDAEFSGKMQGSSMTIWLVGATVLVFLAWAKFAFLDEIVRAEGEVVSASRPQIIQNLEGGILAELLVGEGQIVEQGDVIAKLRGTNFLTSVADLEDQILALEVRRLRLEAEIAGAYEFTVPTEIAERSPEIVASERALLAARQTDYASKVEGARRVMLETKRELDLIEDMLAREIVALIEATKARKAHADAEIKFNEIVTGAELERAAGYSETLQELAQLGQSLRQANDQLSRTVITSPMRGVVNNLSITTIGGVVRPGEEIAQITPLGDELFVEARVKPQDVANVVAGQRATIKFSAYDYTIYGSMSGEVQFVSADTFKDDRQPDADPHYKVTLRVDRDNLDQRQSQIAMRPGLQASVELHTGEKSVLQYLTKPLYRSREALHEP